MMPAVYLDNEASAIAINRLAMDQGTFNDWYDQSEIKLRVKKWCMLHQKLRCCYCRQSASANANLWDFEHILPEITYPQYFSAPLNIAAACKPCNNAKKAQDPRKSKDSPPEEVPAMEIDYIIPHPHLSDWDIHLRHTGYIVYERKTDEGEKLIEFCKLNRAAEIAAGSQPGAARTALQNRWFDKAKTRAPHIRRSEAIAIAQDVIESQIVDLSTPGLRKLRTWLANQERRVARATATSLAGPKTKPKPKPKKQTLAITYKPPESQG